MDAAEGVARQHMEIFGADGYFLEMMDHAIPEEEAIRTGMLEIARRTGLPLVATNDAHYIGVEDAEAHDILLCIQTQARREDEKRFRFAGPALLGDVRARTCATSSPRTARRCATRWPSPTSATSSCSWAATSCPRTRRSRQGTPPRRYLRELCEAGLRERYGDGITTEARERLAMELDVIETTGFAPYFLIVWDLIRAARCDGVVVGPGRGSSAGSLVAYVLRITNVCPLKYGLIFERFLNIERVQMPDIDIDFDDRRRDRVLQYVQGKYGEDRVAQIITFGTMAARAAIRDVGRALNVPLPDVDRLAKLVPLSVEDHARQGARREQGAARAVRQRGLGAAGHRQRPPSRGHLPQRLDARRRRGDRRRAAHQHRAPAALDDGRPQHRGDHVRHGGRLSGGPAQGRLPRAHQPHRHRGGAADDRGLHRDAASTSTRSRSTTPRRTRCCRKADTHGIFQLEATFAKRILIDMQPRTLEDVGAGGCAQPAGADRGRRHRPVHQAQARRAARRVPGGARGAAASRCSRRRTAPSSTRTR